VAEFLGADVGNNLFSHGRFINSGESRGLTIAVILMRTASIVINIFKALGHSQQQSDPGDFRQLLGILRFKFIIYFDHSIPGDSISNRISCLHCRQVEFNFDHGLTGFILAGGEGFNVTFLAGFSPDL